MYGKVALPVENAADQVSCFTNQDSHQAGEAYMLWRSPCDEQLAPGELITYSSVDHQNQKVYLSTNNKSLSPSW